MSTLQAAIKLATAGFYVFPLAPNSKIPALKDLNYNEEATRDLEKIKKWWIEPISRTERKYNVGIITSRYDFKGETKALLAVDIDVNKGGFATLKKLEDDGFEFPPTVFQDTPTGGRHLIYMVDEPLKQGVDVLGRGLDIRSRGGYLVGGGSVIGNKPYTIVYKPIAAPSLSLLNALESADRISPTPAHSPEETIEVDMTSATQRATTYLEKHAPLAVEGSGGDETTFKVAAHLKDLGVDEFTAFELMSDLWNGRCSPPWDTDELSKKVENAYRYGQRPQGINSPEAAFTEITTMEEKKLPVLDDPVTELNREFAAVLTPSGVKIIWKQKNNEIQYLTEEAFHNFFQNRTITDANGKKLALTKLWMKSPNRESYFGICFEPGNQETSNHYNLWTGFTPLSFPNYDEARAKKAFESFKEHIFENIAIGNEAHFKWIMGWFAAIIQKPGKKAFTALVLQGKKGTGKSIVANIVGSLFKSNYISVTNRRYLTGNFNAHLERCLMINLDEAFWSGDKQADSLLKILISEPTHRIERKGMESYNISNHTRVMIMGNEKWLVPATEDERRYAVFEVSQKRMQDNSFFSEMDYGMKICGGLNYLFQYLKEFDLKGIDLDIPPKTQGLAKQKEFTIDPIYDWWKYCLEEGQIEENLEGGWPDTISRTSLKDAYFRHLDDRRLNYVKRPNLHGVFDLLRECCDIKEYRPKVDQSEGLRPRQYKIPPLKECIEQYEKFTGKKLVSPIDTLSEDSSNDKT